MSEHAENGRSPDGGRAAAADAVEPETVSSKADIPNADYLAKMSEYLELARAEGEVPHHWAISPNALEQISGNGVRRQHVLGLPIIVHDEWSWGWMLYVETEYALAIFPGSSPIMRKDAKPFEPRGAA